MSAPGNDPTSGMFTRRSTARSRRPTRTGGKKANGMPRGENKTTGYPGLCSSLRCEDYLFRDSLRWAGATTVRSRDARKAEVHAYGVAELHLVGFAFSIFLMVFGLFVAHVGIIYYWRKLSSRGFRMWRHATE